MSAALGPINLDNRQPTRLKNTKCAYCHSDFLRYDEPQKEHVIGKNFVPKGSHEQHWNLLLNACHACNQSKAALENDISAVTMVRAKFDEVDFDLRLQSEAARKSKATSRLTDKSVFSSFEDFANSGRLGDADFSIGFRAPPQADDERMFRLACYQLQGFHYLLTSDEEKNQGYGWRGSIAPLDAVRRSDWGNPLIVSFAKIVEDWHMRLTTHTASGYFRALIKKGPSAEVWSWALEWNKNYRVFGLYGDNNVLDTLKSPLASAFADMELLWQYHLPNQRIRPELPHDEASDLFFFVRDGSDGEEPS